MTPVAWQCIILRVPARLAPRLADLLWDQGTLGIEERLPGGLPLPVRQPWDEGPLPPAPPELEILAWFDLDGQEDDRRASLAAHLADLPGAAVVREETVGAGGWPETWRERFETLHVAPDIVITPPWRPVPGAIVLEPGMAFGTGDHPTTRACLDAIARYGRAGGTLLDVGCGSGILAMAAARRGMVTTGVDIDPEAVRIARDNASLNHLSCAFSTAPLSSFPTPFDLVVANIFAEEIANLADHLTRLTGGRLVLAGILADRVAVVRRSLPSLVEDRAVREGEWLSLEYLRP